ncbi:MAG: hypothetical protein MUE69_32445 [Myxococcota bacterium]|nr:hypothetical protein [Myxococcota bacterium]
MTKHRATFDQAVAERKEASRERDRRDVAADKRTWLELNRENAIGASVVHLYGPARKLGLR